MAGLSFYGDEETTAFAALSVLETGNPAVPSGMDYYRAPLYSYMAAATAAVLGEGRELSFRLPALAFGVLTVLFVWLGVRRLLGLAVAIVATTLLATSEWHAVTSGYARMYSPYLALFLCTGYGFFRWWRTRSLGILAASAALFLLSASFQILTVFAVVLLLLPHFVRTDFDLGEFLQESRPCCGAGDSGDLSRCGTRAGRLFRFRNRGQRRCEKRRCWATLRCSGCRCCSRI